MQSPDPLTRNSFFPGRLGRRLRPLSLLPSVPGASRKTLPRLASASPPAARDAVASSEPFQLPRPALATPATGLVAPGQALPAGLHCSGAELSRGSGDLRPHTPSTDTLTDTHSRPARGGRGDPRKWIPAWRAPGRGGVDCCQPGPGRRHRCHARPAPTAGRRASTSVPQVT